MQMNRAQRRAAARKKRRPTAFFDREAAGVKRQVMLRLHSNEMLTPAAINRVLMPTGMRLNELRAGDLDHAGMIDLHYAYNLGLYLLYAMKHFPAGIDRADLAPLESTMKTACDALSAVADRSSKARKFIASGDELRAMADGYAVIDAVLAVAFTKHLERAHWAASMDVAESVIDFNRQRDSGFIDIPDYVTHNPAKYQCGLISRVR